MTYLTLAAADLQGLATKTTTMLGKIGGTALIAFMGYHALHHLAAHRVGALVGALLVAVIPAMFFFDPAGSTHLLTNTVHSIAH